MHFFADMSKVLVSFRCDDDKSVLKYCEEKVLVSFRCDVEAQSLVKKLFTSFSFFSLRHTLVQHSGAQMARFSFFSLRQKRYEECERFKTVVLVSFRCDSMRGH